MLVLVAGGTGTLGSAIARRLLDRGTAVRVMTRSPEAAGAQRAAGARIVQGALTDAWPAGR